MSAHDISEHVRAPASEARPSAGPLSIADPVPAGIAGSGMTTFILSCVNAGFFGGAAAAPMVLGLAIFYGGLVQLLAGMWAIRRGETFVAVAFAHVANATFGRELIPTWPLRQGRDRPQKKIYNERGWLHTCLSPSSSGSHDARPTRPCTRHPRVHQPRSSQESPRPPPSRTFRPLARTRQSAGGRSCLEKPAASAIPDLPCPSPGRRHSEPVTLSRTVALSFPPR